MIPLFSHDHPVSRHPVMFPTKWSFIRAGLTINLERVQTYARVFPTVVPSQHFLIKLLFSLDVRMDQALESYYDQVDKRARKLSMAMNMTSPYYKGKVFEGVFYGQGSTEVLLLNEDYFDFMAVNDHWQSAAPIQVLQHPKSDFSMVIPFGKPYSEEQGLTVVSINIAMLAVMYRAFILQRKEKVNGFSPYHFLGGYALPNMLNSHLDLALFNRYYRLAFGIDDDTNRPKMRHPFTMLDYTTQTDLAITQALTYVQSQHRNFTSTLQNLPALVKLDMSEVLRMPDVYPTAQVDWALHAARLKQVHFLLQVCEETAAVTDRTELGRILKAFAHNSVEVMIEQMLPPLLAEQALGDMALIEAITRV